MPTQFVEDNWYDNSRVIDHWRALTVNDITTQFSLDDRVELIRTFLSRTGDLDSGETYCDQRYVSAVEVCVASPACMQYIHTPYWCRGASYGSRRFGYRLVRDLGVLISESWINMRARS